MQSSVHPSRILHCVWQETIPASPYLAHSRERRDYGVSGKDNRSRELAITAIRGIVEQFQAEGELWSQVQEVLHNVSYDMENLVVACAEWEDRALHAEALSSSLENKVSFLGAGFLVADVFQSFQTNHLQFHFQVWTPKI